MIQILFADNIAVTLLSPHTVKNLVTFFLPCETKTADDKFDQV